MNTKILLLAFLVGTICAAKSIIFIADGPEIQPILEKLCESTDIKKIYIGTNSYYHNYSHEKIEYLSLSSRDIYSISKFATQENIDFIIVNHSEALHNGIINLLNHLSLPSFGATQESLFLENTYHQARVFASECGITCPPYTICKSKEEARSILFSHSYPLFLRIDGLYEQEKSFMIRSLDEGLTWIEEWFSESRTNQTLIIEEVLEGELCELIILTDGESIVPLMYCSKEGVIFKNFINTKPLFFEKHKNRNLIIERIIHPILYGLKDKLSVTYKGILHVSCVLVENNPIPCHFSCQFKNPQTSYLMNHLKTNIYQLLKSTFDGTIKDQKLEWDERSTIEIILEKI